ncbi:hypothetical protein ACHHV8_06820 [Paenibacillus sp. TAB 01]|uniref:hypothetical protein n=1 Tax=Paenibacillus sp. TAB 01 TaxID=3368988 RepID=UPI0037523C36
MNERMQSLYEPSDEAYIDAVAVLREQGELNLAIVNRHKDDGAEAEITLPEGYRVEQVWTLTHDQLYASNTEENLENVMPVITDVTDRELKSWNVPAHAVVLIHCKKATYQL